MGFGIANQAIEHKQKLTAEEACEAEMALALSKIVQNVQAASDKKMETFTDFTKDMLKQLVAANKPPTSNINNKLYRHQSKSQTMCTLQPFLPQNPRRQILEPQQECR